MTAEPLRADVPILPELLRDAGYFTGVIGKAAHMPRADEGAWDAVVRSARLGRGRDPRRFGEQVQRVITDARAAGRPYFLAVSTHDPHRPFPGSEDELANSSQRPYPPAPRVFEPSDVAVPGFLPDLAPIRLELARYFAAVYRADAAVGAVLDAAAREGRPPGTLVIFLSDNGMSFPFAKANVYPRSTLTPLILSWPGRLPAGRTDPGSLIASIDVAPTILDLLGLPGPAGQRFDGVSFAESARGPVRADRETFMTAYHGVGELEFPMRAIYFGRLVYIYNAWSDGRTRFVNEAQSGLTMRAMIDAARTDAAVAARVSHYLTRAREELYDVESDPDALADLSASPGHAADLARGRRLLLETMRAVDDPLIDRFAREPFIDDPAPAAPFAVSGRR
jgi:N-sulfoglucosamine sulfohydrolase